ncbi:MAG: ester cyclase [Gemmatimonadota bacterium]|jgi:steroid delta-isomerase-like uncharacterized protein|nr:ester cyclase [Gemmatimonadota bacterium]
MNGGTMEVVRELYGALAERSFERTAGWVHERVRLTSVATGDSYTGRRGFIEFHRGWAAAFPDLHIQSLELVGSDARVVAEYELGGTHTGPLLTPRCHLPATGMEIQVRVVDVLDLENGQITAFRRYFDVVSMLRQLGLVAGTPLHAPDRRAPLELYAQPVDGNAPQRHKAIVHRFFQEVFDRRNAAAAADSCAKRYSWHGGHLGEASSLQDYQSVITSFFVGFPDLEVEVLDTIAEGDRVAVRFAINGTHLGPFKGISPTYSRISGAGTSTFRIADGRIVEEWWQADLLTLLRQLEAKPAPDGTI